MNVDLNIEFSNYACDKDSTLDKSCLKYNTICKKNSSMCIFYIYIGTTDRYKLSNVDYIISNNPTPLQNTSTAFIMEYDDRRNFTSISVIFNNKRSAEFNYKYAGGLTYLIINGYYWI